MAATDDDDVKKPLGPKWRAMSGTTMALTSLAVLGAAAVVSTPVWLYYRRKRKRIDALAASKAEVPGPAEPAAPEPTEPPVSPSS
jgi:hypothetical protein